MGQCEVLFFPFVVKSFANAGMYLNGAVKLLRAMDEKFTNYDPANDHMLDFGTVRYPVDGLTLEKAGVHISIIYGDFFFTEAVLKLLGSDYLIW